MNDKYDFKELIGARLEEIHLAESLPEKMPSDEDILRWETLANARLSARKRKRKQLLSIAAVLLLAVVISVAAIVAPPDAEAGGDGKAVLVENGNGMVVIEYEKIEDVPQTLQEKFIIVDNQSNTLKVKEMHYIKRKNTEQFEMIYQSSSFGEVVLTEIVGDENTRIEGDASFSDRKELWGEKVVYIEDDYSNEESQTYAFMHKDMLILIYTVKENEDIVKSIVEEAF